jgi:hypothetical protein
MKTISIATAALLLAACATSAPTTDQPVAEQKSYRTGSHLPVKDPDSGSGTVITAAPPPPGAPRAAGVPSRTMGGN